MEVSLEAHKIIEFTTYICVDEVEVNQRNHKECQFDVHFIQCQKSTDISRIVKKFVQYIQNFFSICIHFHLTHNF